VWRGLPVGPVARRTPELRLQELPPAADNRCMLGLEPRPESSLRRRRRGKVLVYVGLAFMAIGAPKLVTQHAITVAMALGVLLVLLGAWMERPARPTPVLPPLPPE